MQFSFEQFDGFSVVSFEIEGGVLEYSSLASVTQELSRLGVALDQGVVLSGRGPTWLFGALAHHFHPAQWVGFHDPRLGGAVVVQSHVKEFIPGQLVKF